MQKSIFLFIFGFTGFPPFSPFLLFHLFCHCKKLAKIKKNVRKLGEGGDESFWGFFQLERCEKVRKNQSEIKCYFLCGMLPKIPSGTQVREEKSLFSAVSNSAKPGRDFLARGQGTSLAPALIPCQIAKTCCRQWRHTISSRAGGVSIWSEKVWCNLYLGNC